MNEHRLWRAYGVIVFKQVRRFEDEGGYGYDCVERYFSDDRPFDHKSNMFGSSALNPKASVAPVPDRSGIFASRVANANHVFVISANK
jgi:hypothetical protein